MPKGKLESKTKRERRPVARTNKLGGRKSTKGVAQFSNDELRSKLTGGRGKDQQRARKELVRRGAPLVVEETADAGV